MPEKLKAFGDILHDLLNDLPDHDAITDTLDYVLGALYGLTLAYNLGYADRPGSQVSVYRPYLADYALRIPLNQNIDGLWKSGFYFNSGIQRLASAFDRIPQMLGAKESTAKKRMAKVNPAGCPHWELIYDEINVFKHDPVGKAAGRTALMSDAVAAFEEMLTLIVTNKTEIKARF